MKTSISKIGNDFNKRFTLSVETNQIQTKVYSDYESGAAFTIEMIKDLKETHGPENVKVSAPKKAWHGGELVDIEVKARVWECVFESPNLALVERQEKLYKARN